MEPEARKKLARHGSVEIYDGSYNLKVSHQLSRNPSQTKLEQTRGDLIRIGAGEESSAEGETAVAKIGRAHV